MMNIFGKHLITKGGRTSTAYLTQLAAIQAKSQQSIA
jgi:uncharacterized protein YgbK (DUF1537 family)